MPIVQQCRPAKNKPGHEYVSLPKLIFVLHGGLHQHIQHYNLRRDITRHARRVKVSPTAQALPSYGVEPPVPFH